MSIDSFDTLVEHFSSQYTTSRSHHMTFAALASLRKVDDESLWKFMDRFGHIIVLIQNLNPKVALQSMLLALWPGKFMDNLCKKKKTLVAWTSCANEPKATSRWKRCPSSEIRSDKLHKITTRKRHKSDKRQPLPKGPRHKRHTPLMAKHTKSLRRPSTQRYL